jgi:restriction system protein
MTNESFHYPPELLNLLVDTIPRLVRTKRDVLLFFRGAGVKEPILAEMRTRLQQAPTEVGKFEIARTILVRLNEKGDATLRERREVLKRVVDFNNFDGCYPGDQLEAKGLVAAIRDVVNQKDAFTRMDQAREQEREARLAPEREAMDQRKKKIAGIEAAKAEFYKLFSPQASNQQRGKLLETAFNNIFAAYGILVSQAFHLVGEAGEGVVEQIDGVIELGGHLYYVEMKWYAGNVGKAELSEHLPRLMFRAEGRGIFISANGFTEPAIATAREMLQQKVLVLVTLPEIIRVLEQQADLADFLDKKVKAAQIHKNPFFRPLDEGI